MPSTVDWGSIDLAPVLALPALTRLDDRQLAVVDHIAGLPVPVLPPAEEDFFLKCMRTLRLLPGRGDDEVSGGLRLNLYRRHFGHLSREALAYLTDRATLTCRWFPTPAECVDILKGWERSDDPARAIRRAKALSRHERQARFEEAMSDLRFGRATQEQVDAMPDRWKDIGVTRGHLWPETFKLRPVRPPEPPTTEETSDA